jgi:hypothetical protein
VRACGVGGAGFADRMVAEWMLRMVEAWFSKASIAPYSTLRNFQLIYVQTLNFTCITQLAFSLEDELRRLPPLSHVKEVYVNGRLWYDQPVSLVEATMNLFAGSPELETLVLSRPVQTYIPFDDAVVSRPTASR